MIAIDCYQLLGTQPTEVGDEAFSLSCKFHMQVCPLLDANTLANANTTWYGGVVRSHSEHSLSWAVVCWHVFWSSPGRAAAQEIYMLAVLPMSPAGLLVPCLHVDAL